MTNETPDVDVVVIGAGFAGLYATHRLRNLQGLSVQSFEAGHGPGGTWYWNRYPGARCDIESIYYSYSFDADLQREWRWSERFAQQPEILAYLEHVADRFDLRRSFKFGTRVTSVVWDEAAAFWRVGADDGSSTTARYVLNGSGNLSTAKPNDFPGEEDFTGQVLRTSAWPAAGVDLRGKRVAVVGTGSTGIQVISELAGEVAELTVFQRTPNFACPLGNRPMSDEEFAEVTRDYSEIRAVSRKSMMGTPYPPALKSALADGPEERRAAFEKYYDGGGFRMLLSTYNDLLFNEDSNALAAEFIREQIRKRVTDPAVAAKLCPTDHPYGTKRAPFETNYFEVFNESHVHLVDAKATPIERITATGIRTTDREYDVDVIVLATGFDAGTGTLMRLGVAGRDGITLNESWKEGPHTFLGLATRGFPNLFLITGPQSASGLYNNPIAIEDHVDFAGDLIEFMRDRELTAFEPTADSEKRWMTVISELSNMTLFPKANSWYMGDNIKGKPRVPMMFTAGAPLYRAICAEVVSRGYGGFSFDGAATSVPSVVDLDPSVLMVLGGMLAQGMKPLEEGSLEEIRSSIEGFRALQLPLPPSVTITETTFTGPAGERAVRVYRPDRDGTLPIVVFVHGGGMVAGSLDGFDEPCARLAETAGVVVVSPDYRLAPEDPFPAAPDDTYAALVWAHEHAAEFGADPDQLAIGGESGGANLAAVAALRARDEGGPTVRAQLLVAPAIDPAAQTQSRIEFADGPMLTLAAMAKMFTWYLPDLTQLTSPQVAPARAATLAGLPPTLVVTMEADPLRDEGEDYADALRAAGVPTVSHRLDGMVHTTLSMSGALPRAAEIHELMSEFVSAHVFDAVPAPVA